MFARRVAGAHAGVSLREISAVPPSVTSLAGSSRGCALTGDTIAATRRITPARTAAGTVLGTLRPPWISVGVPNSVARAAADTSQTPGRGARARRARTWSREGIRRGARGCSARRAPGPAPARRGDRAGREWLPPGPARRPLLEERGDTLARIVGEGHQRDQLPQLAKRGSVLHLRRDRRRLLGEAERGGRVAGDPPGQCVDRG